MANFVPAHLPYLRAEPGQQPRLTRELIREHCTEIARTVLGVTGDTLVTIFDGTYLYVTKSLNFQAQRVTYSGYKKQNLYKPMAAVAPDGYILRIFEMWEANLSGGEILKDIMGKQWF